MNGRVYGALVQFGCYQHRHECMLSPIHIRLSLELSCNIAVGARSVVKSIGKVLGNTALGGVQVPPLNTHHPG